MPDIAENFKTPGSWEFTPEVVKVFDEHVTASVPFYNAIQSLIAECADWLAPANSVIVDLGTATGTTVNLIRLRHPQREHRFYLYDESAEMLEAARVKLENTDQVHCKIGRLEYLPFDHAPASLTLALFTLQFLEPTDRDAVLYKAREATKPGGAILIAEKLRLPDARWSEIAISVSHDQKESQGIDASEIRKKERALRGVLIPRTDAENRHAIEQAGWESVETLFRWHQWAIYGAFAK